MPESPIRSKIKLPLSSGHFDRAVMLDGDYIGAVHPFEIYDDALRTNPDLRQQYRELKNSLSEKYKHDRAKYSESKGVFIETTLAKWRAQQDSKR